MLAAARATNERGAARRRPRRLRQWLRHERLSVATALAESNHHTAPRGQKQARAREGRRAELHGHEPGDPLSPPPLPLPQPELFELSFDEESGGSRPDRLAGVRPQERVQRHTVSHSSTSLLSCRFSNACAADGEPTGGIHEDARHCDPRAGYRSAQDLSRQNPAAICGPAPSAESGTVGGPTGASSLRRLDTAVVEQVIAVPKLSIDSIPLRSVLCETQMASRSSTFQFLARMVYLDTEVFKVSFQNRVLFLLPSRRWTFQFLALVVVMEVFQVFTQDKVPCSALFSRSLTFLFQVKVLKIFSLILVRQLLPQFRVKSLGKVFFSHFSPSTKEYGGRRIGGCEGARALELIHAEFSSSGSTVHGSRP